MNVKTRKIQVVHFKKIIFILYYLNYQNFPTFYINLFIIPYISGKKLQMFTNS